MMTALQIEDRRSGLFRFLRRNRIRVEHRYCDSASLKCITYEHYRGKIGWQAIDRFVKAQRNRLLCPPALELPVQSGYKRFVSYELSRRMCENAALFLLRSVGCRGVRTVLIDHDGDSAGLCEYLADLCDPVCVITHAAGLYALQADYLLNEKGAALRICSSDDCLADADLIIAPQRLCKTLPCPPQALILTGEKPEAEQNAPAIYDYYFELPSKYRELCPPYLDEMAFASALFVMAGARELGSEVFTRCGDGCVLHTRMSLAEALKNRLNSH